MTTNSATETEAALDVVEDAATIYGACGVAGCTECLPLYDADDNPLPE